MDNPTIGNRVDGQVDGAVVQAGRIAGGVHLHLGRAAPTAHVPREVPTAPAWFTDRVDDVAWCERELADTSPTTPLVLVLHGPGGVGKSALAARWLADHVADFPDGQLHADLGGYTAAGGETAAAAGRFLRTLGIDASDLPVELDGLAAMLRTATRTRRVAVLLDGASSAAQVRPLLPSGAGCVAVVTAQGQLDALALDGARFRTLGTLAPDAAYELLKRALGIQRVQAEDHAAREVVQLCAGLPLALGIVAARLAARPSRSLTEMSAALAPPEYRLDHLTVDGTRAVYNASDVAYEQLSPESARLYRLIGALPTATVDGNGAAALLDCPVAHGCGLLDTLANETHLIEEIASSDYRMPELVRLHAAARAREDPQDVDAALARYGEYLLASATAAEERLTPSHRVLPRTYTVEPPRSASFHDDAAALDWLERYRERLATAVTYFGERGARTLVWQLADAMWPLFLRLRVPDVREWVQQLGLDAARADGAEDAEGMFLTSLGGTALSAGRLEDSTGHYEAALALYERSGNSRGMGQAANGLGKVSLERGDLVHAGEMFERALAERTAADYQRGVYLSNEGLGRVALAQGDPRRAADHFETSSEGLLSIGDNYDGAWSLGLLAVACAMSGDFARADTLISRARTMMVDCGTRFGQAGIEDLAATVAEHRGDLAAVRLHLSAAAEHYAASDLRYKDQILARICRLDTPIDEC